MNELTPEQFERAKRADAAGTLERVKRLARFAQAEPDRVGVLSTGEKCAVALLLNNVDFLPEGYTMAQAADRLDNRSELTVRLAATNGDWLCAVIRASREGWLEDDT